MCSFQCDITNQECARVKSWCVYSHFSAIGEDAFVQGSVFATREVTAGYWLREDERHGDQSTRANKHNQHDQIS